MACFVDFLEEGTRAAHFIVAIIGKVSLTSHINYSSVILTDKCVENTMQFAQFLENQTHRIFFRTIASIVKKFGAYFSLRGKQMSIVRNIPEELN